MAIVSFVVQTIWNLSCLLFAAEEILASKPVPIAYLIIFNGRRPATPCESMAGVGYALRASLAFVFDSLNVGWT